MIRTCQYLGYEKLFELACAKVGDYLKDMDIDGLWAFFGIKNDFSVEEELDIQKGKVDLIS